MATKALVQKSSGNGHRHQPGETQVEDPKNLLGAFISEDQQGISQNETEVEEVDGFTLFRPEESDKEVSNQLEIEAVNIEQSLELEESGFEIPTEESMPLDALYASYSELLSEVNLREVILGVDNRVRIMNTTVFPWRAICSLKITAKDGSRWIGTGWLVSPRTVITAGHCVFMHDHGGWAKSIEVIAGLNDASRPYGSCSSSTLRSVTGWVNSKNRNYDYGAIILPSNCRPGDRTGYFGFGVKPNSYLMSSVLNLSGYPGDKGGNQQWFMAMKPKTLSARVITYNIDTMGGQSGAPVWIKVGNTRTCVGIHTNGHTAGNSATRIVTPVFNNIQTWKNLGL